MITTAQNELTSIDVLFGYVYVKFVGNLEFGNLVFDKISVGSWAKGCSNYK